ncbi:response regulator [Kiloniella laminariae]|uniref:response regulator n=1 Tax=Kiloniella laminariae TaxID=454162 RepID=UPI000370D6FA|nr:response regulator [Kiloniella laminariae]
MKETLRILVVDDSADDRELCCRALKKAQHLDFVTQESCNADEALEALAIESPYDCVLLDYSMPGKSGFEALKAIRAKYSFLPVVILTGQGDEAIAVKVMKGGAQDYLTKTGITSESLSHTVLMAIERCALLKCIEKQRDSLETFTRVLTHDLKQPLRMIRSFLQLIDQQEGMSDKNQEFFSHVITATSNMDALIDMVHYYTRLDSLNEGDNRAAVDLNKVVRSVLSNLAQTIKENKAVIEAEILPHVFANDIQLVQLFQNLMLNAIIHNSSNQTRIKIDCTVEGTWATIKFKDNGPGIKADYLNRVFDPFSRFNPNGRGSGLGLAICQKIVEYQGGNIWCKSKLGSGSSFEFTLPYAEAERTEQTIGLHGKQQEQDQKKEGGTEALANVLLVEDDEMDVKLAKIMLFDRDKIRFNLKRARNGQEALEILRSLPPSFIDLVLLDINMPVMGGFEFLQKLRDDPVLKSTPVIMCTTSTYDRDIRHARNLGVVGYINKPVSLDKIRHGLSGYHRLDLIPQGETVQLCRH